MVHDHGIDADRPSDVLQFAFAEIEELPLQLGTQLFVSRLRQANASGLRYPLQARGDVDAIAHQIAVAFLNHVPYVDADPKDNPAILRHAGIALGHRALDFDSAVDRVDCAPELDESAVAGAFEDTTAVNSDGRVDQVAPEGP